ncbi:MAG: aldehyde dehydrogenase family protein [Deltaproteobacteria bacterium]|nr:MAG: aldehyde dehydrogenase family protein [Deltaproteobacteria bacterium]
MEQILSNLGIEAVNHGGFHGKWLSETEGGILDSVSPIDGRVIARVHQVTEKDYERVIEKAQDAFRQWRLVPAPRRGEVVRQIALELRKHKKDLGALVSWEMGKIRAEGEGEVQEMIDIADFAVGLSRQLYGKTMHSERPRHRMYEQWHPLGVVGVITAFNFPVAVWAWNAMIALVCGDSVVWKPSSQTPLCAIACMKIVSRVLEENDVPEGVLGLVIGSGATVGTRLVEDRRVPLISFTGSTKQGKKIAEKVGARLGRTILELGGNNAIIVSQHGDLDMAVRTILFGAVGTAGQRCTSTRRIIVHESVYDEVIERLVRAYKSVRIGNPLEEGILMGPLVTRQAVEEMMRALEAVRREGGEVVWGGMEVTNAPSNCYVTPAIVKARNEWPIVQEETFAPILYAIPYRTIEEAIAIHNDVPQGLSSAIFSLDLRETERFLSHAGSDCGIANVNVSTSGAEIGGAFGGEKETGGGRESGSDAWKQYMRRQTNTINWSNELPLAQGIHFG